jgi:hypothetical protein
VCLCVYVRVCVWVCFFAVRFIHSCTLFGYYDPLHCWTVYSKPVSVVSITVFPYPTYRYDVIYKHGRRVVIPMDVRAGTLPVRQPHHGLLRYRKVRTSGRHVCLGVPIRGLIAVIIYRVAWSYHEVVTVSVNEPVHIIRYTWCLNIPPRCPDNRQEYRTIHKNIVSDNPGVWDDDDSNGFRFQTVPKTRRKKVCCENQIQLYEDCIPKCTEEQCLNIKCVPGTARCKCKSGFVGQLCQQS